MGTARSANHHPRSAASWHADSRQSRRQQHRRRAGRDNQAVRGHDERSQQARQHNAGPKRRRRGARRFTFSSLGMYPSARINRLHGRARWKTSVLIRPVSVQCFRCVTSRSFRTRMRPPLRDRRKPSSMSSMRGTSKRSSNPPSARNAGRLNRPARAPEGHGVVVGLLMHEAVRQILELRDEVRRGRRPVV